LQYKENYQGLKTTRSYESSESFKKSSQNFKKAFKTIVEAFKKLSKAFRTFKKGFTQNKKLSKILNKSYQALKTN
jgi:inorganic pyrophosphatase